MLVVVDIGRWLDLDQELPLINLLQEVFKRQEGIVRLSQAGYLRVRVDVRLSLLGEDVQNLITVKDGFLTDFSAIKGETT